MRHRAFVAVMCVVLAAGCMESLEEQTKKSPNSIIGKTTQDIGEFDPNAGHKVQSGKVKISDPITGPLQAYGPIVQQISTLGIEHAVNLFHASEGRYPKDHDEFMQRIIKENQIRLPVLPGQLKYQYDVPNHRLMVVEIATGKEVT